MIKRGLEYIRGLTGLLVGGNILMMLGSLAAMSVPYWLGLLFDMPSDFLMTGALMLICMAVSSACGCARTCLLARLSSRISVRIRMDVMKKLLRMPHAYFTAHSSGELLSVVGNDITLFRDALSGGVTYVIESMFSMVFILVLMLKLDAVLTGVLLLSTLLLLSANLLATRSATDISSGIQEKLAEINVLTAQGVLGNQEVRSYRLEDIGLRMLHSANRDWAVKTVRLEQVRARTSLAAGLLSAAQLVLLLVLGMYRVQLGIITIGTLTSFILYAQSASGSISSVSSLFVDVRRAFAAMRRVFAVLDVPEDRRGLIALPSPVRGHIVLDRVSHSYSAGEEKQEVLCGVSMDIPAGSTAALVGESGSGKTTIIRLLTGFLPIEAGDIRIDGLSLRETSPDSLHEAIALVSQNPFLFQMSVRDNIACGRPDATDEEIERAARMACAHEFISHLPEGYGTLLGENGVNLSGGQRQRLAIARAFLKNAPILLLDEATSALDNHTEASVQQAVQTLMQGRTTLIIAHRLSTIRNADRIFYLQDGRVLDSGRHEELLVRCPAYRELHQRSADGAKSY